MPSRDRQEAMRKYLRRGVQLAWRHGLQPLALNNGEESVYSGQRDGFSRPVGPHDLQLLYPLGGAQAKVDSQVALRDVSPPGCHFASLAKRAAVTKNDGANRVARRLERRISNQL